MAEEVTKKWWLGGFVDDILEDILALPSPRKLLTPVFPKSVLNTLGLPTLDEVGTDIAKKVEEKGKAAARV